MTAALAKPVLRSPLRLAMGKTWFITRRRVEWYLPGKHYAVKRVPEPLTYLHTVHKTPMLRQLKNVDMWLQHNKVASLGVAASCIDGLILTPGETFSFWRLVGKPSARRGFKTGMVLRNGAIAQGMGGGLCQMTSLIYWMAIHTDLTITERWRGYSRHNTLVRRRRDSETGAELGEEFVTQNHAIMMYEPLLASPEEAP